MVVLGFLFLPDHRSRRPQGGALCAEFGQEISWRLSEGSGGVGKGIGWELNFCELEFTVQVTHQLR